MRDSTLHRRVFLSRESYEDCQRVGSAGYDERHRVGARYITRLLHDRGRPHHRDVESVVGVGD